MLYLDTSAFMKIVVAEEHSADLRSSLAGLDLWSSSLLAVEAHRSALRLGISEGEIDLRLAAVTLIAPSETLYFAARRVGTADLRTLDALHLSAALELAPDLDAVATYDRRLAVACAGQKINVHAPGLTDRWWIS